MRSVNVAITCTLLALASASQAQAYHVADHWKIGGTGGWDYLLSDDSAHRLYVTHNNRVEVLDTLSGKLVGAVTGLKSTHGIALNPDGRTGYASDGAGNAIVVFDRSSLAVSATVSAGTNPDGIAFEPSTDTVWAFNGRSKDVTVMDIKSNKVIASITLPGKPEFPQVDGKGAVFVNIEDKNEIVKLDAATKKVTATWPLSGCESPSGMAIDLVHHRLFSVCDGKKMSILSYDSGKVLGLASIGDSPDAAGFDPKTGIAFSSNGDGTLTLIDTTHPAFSMVQSVPTARGARTMAFDAANGRVYLSAAKYGPAPAPTPANPHPRATALPDSFEILVLSR